jgi:ABC-type dipeptide/oligopeptide/nickel transport system ATPase component
LSTVSDCDQIFVMDEGRIVEQGTHDQLVARHGIYFAMAKHQMKLEEPLAAGPLVPSPGTPLIPSPGTPGEG